MASSLRAACARRPLSGGSLRGTRALGSLSCGRLDMTSPLDRTNPAYLLCGTERSVTLGDTGTIYSVPVRSIAEEHPMSATTFPVLDRAHAALAAVAAGISTDQLASRTPCADWTVAQVLQHAAGDQRAYAQAITGTDGPDADPFSPSGSLDGSVEALVGPAVAASSRAFTTVDAAAATPVPVPPGELAGTDAAAAAALDAGVHAWDLARATGQPSPLDDDLAAPLLELARQIVEPLRQWGAYAAVVPAGAGEPEQPVVDELLRYLGRDPRWAPSA